MLIEKYVESESVNLLPRQSKNSKMKLQAIHYSCCVTDETLEFQVKLRCVPSERKVQVFDNFALPVHSYEYGLETRTNHWGERPRFDVDFCLHAS